MKREYLIQCERCLQLCLPESERSLLLPLLEPDSMLLLADVLKSVSLCTSLLQDSLLGLPSTGEGGELVVLSAGAERAGMVLSPFAVFNGISCFLWSAVCEERERKNPKDKHSNSK